TVPERFTVEQFFALVDEGVLQPDDSVELLEGVIVAMAPSNPPHASATTRVANALRGAAGKRALVREEKSLILGLYSAPEPDVALVPGTEETYDDAHPRAGPLVAEVADSSLAQDRLPPHLPPPAEPARLADEVAFLRAWQRKLHDGRWVGIHWPRDYGGRGASVVEHYLFQEEIAAARAPEIINRIGVNLVGPTLIA